MISSDYRPSAESRAWLRGLVLAIAWGCLVPAGDVSRLPAEEPAAAASVEPGGQSEPVGRREGGELMTPVNQRVTPLGTQLDLPGMRPQALALHPSGKLLLTAGKTSELVVVDAETFAVRQRVPLPAEPGAEATPAAPAEQPATAEATEAPPAQIITPSFKPDTEGQVSYTGLICTADGRRVLLSNVNGSIKVFTVAEDGTVAPSVSWAMPPAGAPRRQAEIPAGLTLSADGRRLYVALNLSNRLAELDADSGKVLRTWDVGVAPFDVRLVGSRALVSNWGGRRPQSGDLTGPAGQGTRVRVDPQRHIASEGTVSVIDLEGQAETQTIQVGLHPSALAVSPSGEHLVVANSASDTLSVIELKSLQVVETIWTKQNAATLFGAMPNALAFDATGRWLYVANGGMNCLAAIEFRPGESELEGLLPVGWFPGALVYDVARGQIHVANIKGLGPGRPRASNGRAEFNTHQYHGSLTRLELPSEAELPRHTARVLQNCREPQVLAALAPARPGRPPQPVPERTGEPSLFEHVVYIIKENRTYDQVLGDLPAGNGDAELCVFGREVTPNQHQLVEDFVLLDNTYCSGILSADGHQWSDAGLVTDYLERSFAGFPRSYPDGMTDEDVDALAYSPAGFLWDAAIQHGKSLRVYGEFAITEARWKDPGRGKLTFLDYYRDFRDGTGLISIRSRPAIESLRPYLCETTVGWDMDIPDVFRAEQFIRELKAYEAKGEFPQLSIICLPNDHTSGTKPGAPTPAAQVADNDLAFGRIVEALSKSRFWRKTCILAIEDDPQAGWDHVSGYRTTAYVVSPYSRLRRTVSTQYNQTSLLRTMELILGLPPMNLMVASATPMHDCFGPTVELAPFTAIANRVPLDEMNPEPEAVSDPLLREHAVASAALPLDEIDRCPEDLLNRILWHAQMGSAAPFPEWAISAHEDEEEEAEHGLR